jgi:hypothetical protein
MATIGADSNKGIPLPVFDGENKNFQIWWTRFKAYAAVKKFAQAIKTTADPNLPAKEDAANLTAAQTTALERNMMAIASLTMAFQTEGLMNVIYKAESDDWPSGKAHIVVELLFKKYKPVDTISRVEMRQRLNQVSMKNNQDPKVLFDQLASIENAYNTANRQIDQDDLIAVVLDKAPRDYKAVLTSEQRSKGIALTLADLESAMNDLYRTLHPQQASTKDNNEFSLAAFSGMCHYCKKKGHQAKDCRKKKADQKNKSENSGSNGEGRSSNLRPCKHCGGKHMDYQCWELPQNANKRPEGWKSKKTETGAVAQVQEPRVEFLLNGIESSPMTFPNDQALLKDPNVWIADTAASMHMSPYDQGMVNIKANNGNGITVGSGEVMIAKHKGDIPS